MPKIKLTDAIIQDLVPKPGKAQTEFYDLGFRVTGVSFYLLVGKTAKTFYVKALGRSRFKNLGHWASSRDQKTGLHGLSIAQARAKAAIIAGDIAAGRNPSTDDENRRRTAHPGKTIASLKERWVAYLKRPEEKGSPVPRIRTWPEYEANLRTQVLPAWGRRLPQEIEPQDARELVLGICNRGAFNRADKTLRAMRSFFDWCVLEGVTTKNPAKEVESLGSRLGPAKPQSWRPMTWNELLSVWRACEEVNGKITRWLRLLMLLGARPRSLLGAMWTEFELVDGDYTWWRIPGARVAEVDGQKQHVGGNKSKEEHLLWVGTPTARRLLDECRAESESIWLFPGRHTHVKPTSTKDVIDKVRRISGVDDFVPRLCKATFCTRALEAGSYSIAKPDISLVADHRIPGVPIVTQEHYIGMNDADLHRIRETLEIWGRELTHRLEGRKDVVVEFPRQLSPSSSSSRP